MNTMEEEIEIKDIAYLAGIVDNGGKVGIRKRKPREKSGEINDVYTITFRIISKNKQLLQWIVKTFGGKMHIGKEGTNGILYAWRPTKDELMPILLKIYPFLHLKKEQVGCLMSFFNNCKKDCRQYHHTPNIPLPPSEVKLRENYYLEMKELKKNAISYEDNRRKSIK